MYYVVLRGERGLKLYMNKDRSFLIVKHEALAFAKKEDAEMVAMAQTFADPRWIGRLEVVAEDEGDHQDLKRYHIGDLVSAFSDIQFNIDAVPIRR